MRNDKSVTLYFKQLENYPLLTRKEEKELLKLKNLPTTEGVEARNKLINSNLRLVVSIAKRFQGNGMPIEDLIQEGSMGLMKAIDKFDCNRDNKLSTYATSWIYESIVRAIPKQGKAYKVPNYMQLKIKDLKKRQSEFEKINGRIPSVEELASVMGMSKDEVVQLYSYDRAVQYLDDEGEADYKLEITDVNAIDPYDAAVKSECRRMINEVLDKFPLREKIIMQKLFGLNGNNPMPLREVAKLPECQISAERVRQIKEETIKKIIVKYGNSLKDFLDLP